MVWVFSIFCKPGLGVFLKFCCCCCCCCVTNREEGREEELVVSKPRGFLGYGTRLFIYCLCFLVGGIVIGRAGFWFL